MLKKIKKRSSPPHITAAHSLFLLFGSSFFLGIAGRGGNEYCKYNWDTVVHNNNTLLSVSGREIITNGLILYFSQQRLIADNNKNSRRRSERFRASKSNNCHGNRLLARTSANNGIGKCNDSPIFFLKEYIAICQNPFLLF